MELLDNNITVSKELLYSQIELI